LKSKVTIKVNAVSKTALEKIEKLGGSVTLS
jgi:ribosomal protein L15